jgi:ABC-type multidrug transport system fused ATPase/permease subunit
MRRLRARVRAWWSALTFATRRPARTVAALTTLGAVAGLGEALVVILVVAVASNRLGRNLPLLGSLPHGTWARAALALTVLLVVAAAHLASAWVTARTAAESQQALRRMLLEAYLGAGTEAQSSERTGQLQELVMTGATQVAVGTQQAARALTMSFNLVVVVAAAVVVSVWATLGLVVVGALSLLLVRPLRVRTRRMAGAATEASGELATEVTETAMLARELRVGGVVEAARLRLDDRVVAGRRLFEALRLRTTAIPTLMRDITMGVVIVAVAAVASSGDVSLPALGASVLLLLRALSYAQSIAGISAQFEERAANVERITRFLGRWQASAGPGGTRRCDRVHRLALRSVSYTYSGGAKPALSGVSLELDRGEQIGLVGRTGAGKSTLALVMLGLLEPHAGQVLIDDVPLTEIRRADWHRLIAWVSQEPRLLTGTAGDNIRFLRDELRGDDVRLAAEEAGLRPELAAWPDGLDHHVGPGGVALSVGQRQRIALARALAGDPDLLVLDEPTSALDVHTEVAVRDAIGALHGRTTVVVIAHRLSTLDACDRVAVLDGGRLLALGAPGELAAEDAYYREALSLSGLRP